MSFPAASSSPEHSWARTAWAVSERRRAAAAAAAARIGRSSSTARGADSDEGVGRIPLLAADGRGQEGHRLFVGAQGQVVAVGGDGLGDGGQSPIEEASRGGSQGLLEGFAVCVRGGLPGRGPAGDCP